MIEKGEVKLLEDNNNKNISKKKGIICNSDIEGLFEFYPKLFIKYGLFNNNFKKDFPELCSIIENPPSNWSGAYNYKGKTYSYSYYIRFMSLIQNMLSVLQTKVGRYLNKDFDKQIILCGDFISNRPFENGHYPSAQQIQIEATNLKQATELYSPKMLNFYIVKLLTNIKSYLKTQTTSDNTEKLDNHSLILIAGNHELFTCGDTDSTLNEVKCDFAASEVLQPYYVTYDKNGNELIFKHAPFATKEQYEEMMSNNNPSYIKVDDLLIWDIAYEKQEMTKAIKELKSNNTENNYIYDYNELFNTNDETLLQQYGDELKKIKNSFDVFKKYGAEKYIKKHHFYWNFFDDSKVYPMIGHNYFNTDEFKKNNKVLLVHGHTHEGQRGAIPSTTFREKKCNDFNSGKCIQHIEAYDNDFCLSTGPRFEQATENYVGEYLIPSDMKDISKDRIKKDRRFCIDTDLFAQYFSGQESNGGVCFFTKTYQRKGHDSYVHNFLIDLTEGASAITAIDHWNANEKKSKHIYEIDNIFETKTINNCFASICSPSCSCCSCGCDFLSCG